MDIHSKALGFKAQKERKLGVGVLKGAVLSDVALPVVTSRGRQQLSPVSVSTPTHSDLFPRPLQLASLVLEAFSIGCSSQ